MLPGHKDGARFGIGPTVHLTFRRLHPRPRHLYLHPLLHLHLYPSLLCRNPPKTSRKTKRRDPARQVAMSTTPNLATKDAAATRKDEKTRAKEEAVNEPRASARKFKDPRHRLRSCRKPGSPSSGAASLTEPAASPELRPPALRRRPSLRRHEPHHNLHPVTPLAPRDMGKRNLTQRPGKRPGKGSSMQAKDPRRGEARVERNRPPTPPAWRLRWVRPRRRRTPCLLC